MVCKIWDAFTKRVLVEKHISGNMCENPERRAPPPPLPSFADAHGKEIPSSALPKDITSELAGLISTLSLSSRNAVNNQLYAMKVLESKRTPR